MKNEPVQQVKSRRDKVLMALVHRIPYLQTMGISFDRRGDELTCLLGYHGKLIGNPVVERLHGGATASFLETCAIITLAWQAIWEDMESGALNLEALETGALPPYPKTIDLTVDYLRPGLPRDAYARARITRAGRRYASVHVEGWQDNRSRLFAQATGHFLMPQTAADKK